MQSNILFFRPKIIVSRSLSHKKGIKRRNIATVKNEGRQLSSDVLAKAFFDHTSESVIEFIIYT